MYGPEINYQAKTPSYGVLPPNPTPSLLSLLERMEKAVIDNREAGDGVRALVLQMGQFNQEPVSPMPPPSTPSDVTSKLQQLVDSLEASTRELYSTRANLSRILG